METPYRTLDGPADAHNDRFDAAIRHVGFVLYRDRPIDWSINKLVNQRHDIIAFATAGRAWYRCGSERFEARRGTMLFFPRGTSHSARSDPKAPWSFYSVGFHLEPTADGTLDAFHELPHRLRLANVTQISDTFKQLQRLWTTREPGYSMACRGLILLLMQQYAAAAVRANRRVPHSERLQRIIKHLHDHVGHIYAVGELADMAGLSESRFRLLFSQLTGSSVTRYQNRLRIQAAQDRLASGQFRVGEVAGQLGFRDVYYFSRLFKRMTGVSPSAWSQT
ncbi:AraC family transcriptional regulator [Phycisphaerales bacterium AB-hyl4]|uniref:AraC family transcriptional regulator n=1 Tax=Natronomicrosphaera hydrolytica TaxID=3242702 RepID=A0ABV4UAI1_9BACT